MILEWLLVAEPPEQTKMDHVRYVHERSIKYGYDRTQFSCLVVLIQRESRWDYQAQNPDSTAYGLFQMLKTPKELPVKKQVTRGFRYIKRRYDDDPCNAIKFHNLNGWY
jgi:predicted oxidoreductase